MLYFIDCKVWGFGVLGFWGEALRRAARGRDLTLVLTSDAHETSELGRVGFAWRSMPSGPGSTRTASSTR